MHGQLNNSEAYIPIMSSTPQDRVEELEEALRTIAIICHQSSGTDHDAAVLAIACDELDIDESEVGNWCPSQRKV